MINETIVISDTNIFLDLISVNLLKEFFCLPCNFSTTDFVINEIIQPVQQKQIDIFVKSKKLDVVSFDSTELAQITSMFAGSKNNTSLSDCSVWYYAKQTGGRLLTGDGNLRKSAEADNIKVSGILFIFDNLIEYGILDKKKAADLLEQLTKINMRLPKAECEQRISDWRKD